MFAYVQYHQQNRREKEKKTQFWIAPPDAYRKFWVYIASNILTDARCCRAGKKAHYEAKHARKLVEYSFKGTCIANSGRDCCVKDGLLVRQED